jgi:ERCC4-type nuclease
MRVVIDTREQRPYSFEEFDCERRALPAGDYSLAGLEESFAIERKSVQDLIHTVLRGRRRFTRELQKLQSYQFAAVVIEGSLEDILSGTYTSDIAPAALLGIIVGIMQAYHPVHVVFAHDRGHAHALVTQMLKQGDKYYGSRS